MVSCFLWYLLYFSLTVVFWDNCLDSSDFLSMRALIRLGFLPLCLHLQQDPAQECSSGIRQCSAALACEGKRQADAICTTLCLKKRSFVRLDACEHSKAVQEQSWLVSCHLGWVTPALHQLSQSNSFSSLQHRYPCTYHPTDNQSLRGW